MPAVQVIRTSALSSVGTSWTALDSGGAIDLTLAASTGDVIEVGISALSPTATGDYVWFDAATIVSGSPVNWVAKGTTSHVGGPIGWFTSANTKLASYPIGGSVLYTVKAGDVSGGNVTFRFYGKANGASRSLTVSTTNPAHFYAVSRTGSVAIPSGTGVGAFAWAGSAAGSASRSGSGTGAFAWVGTGVGSNVRSGAGSGAFGWVGAGVGSAPVVAPIPSGSGSGAFGWVGTGIGYQDSVGAAVGAFQWDGVATGITPEIISTGGGSYGWEGAASGSSERTGGGAGNFAWIGTGEGHETNIFVVDYTKAHVVMAAGSALHVTLSSLSHYVEVVPEIGAHVTEVSAPTNHVQLVRMG